MYQWTLGSLICMHLFNLFHVYTRVVCCQVWCVCVTLQCMVYPALSGFTVNLGVVCRFRDSAWRDREREREITRSLDVYPANTLRQTAFLAHRPRLLPNWPQRLSSPRPPVLTPVYTPRTLALLADGRSAFARFTLYTNRQCSLVCTHGFKYVQKHGFQRNFFSGGGGG